MLESRGTSAEMEFSMNTMYLTDRLILKILPQQYTREVLNFQLRNREIFERYEPTHPDNFYTPAHQQVILKCEYNLAMKLSTVRYYVFKKEEPKNIIGTVCLHDILRMPYCYCEIGYKFDFAFQHQGYAREAVTKALEIAFSDLGLHRVYARVMPENAPSIHLLESLHFTCEGLEHSCTQIMGKWEDHLRYALISPNDYSSI